MFGFCFQYGFYCKQYIYPRIVRPQIPSLLIFYFRCTCDGVFNPCTAAKKQSFTSYSQVFLSPKKVVAVTQGLQSIRGGKQKKNSAVTDFWKIPQNSSCQRYAPVLRGCRFTRYLVPDNIMSGMCFPLCFCLRWVIRYTWYIAGNRVRISW